MTLPHDWAAALPYDEAASNRHAHRAVTAVDMDGEVPGKMTPRRALELLERIGQGEAGQCNWPATRAALCA